MSARGVWSSRGPEAGPTAPSCGLRGQHHLLQDQHGLGDPGGWGKTVLSWRNITWAPALGVGGLCGCSRKGNGPVESCLVRTLWSDLDSQRGEQASQSLPVGDQVCHRERRAGDKGCRESSAASRMHQTLGRKQDKVILRLLLAFVRLLYGLSSKSVHKNVMNSSYCHWDSRWLLIQKKTKSDSLERSRCLCWSHEAPGILLIVEWSCSVLIYDVTRTTDLYVNYQFFQNSIEHKWYFKITTNCKVI